MKNKFSAEYICGLSFADETELFRTPAEVIAGESVTLRVRTAAGAPVTAWLVTDGGDPQPLHHTGREARFDWHTLTLRCPEETLRYCFVLRIPDSDQAVLIDRLGSRLVSGFPEQPEEPAFRLIPGFHVPAWARGALQYQIMVDRFASASLANEVRSGEYSYVGERVRHAKTWDELPQDGDYRVFYGGDLQGILDRVDYLKSLGVEAIYFNPIFVSPSSHKYDTQDYRHVDPHFAAGGAVSEDGLLPEGTDDNRMALRYRELTTEETALETANRYFAALCQELHRQGIRIILDGVFNHCGSFHYWLNGAGLYNGKVLGALDDKSSPYREYFNFENGMYESWYGFPTLPKLNYEASEALCEEIYRIAEKWAKPPYSIDGWRLDVGSELGHSEEFNHRFWQEFRRRVKAVNPEILIVAEHYGDPSAWLQGNEWDSVMNYDAFMDPVSYFLTGMEKHSDRCCEELYQNGEQCLRSLTETMAHLPENALLCAMNQLSNHDHSRFLTRTNRTVGRVATLGSARAGEGIDKAIFREAVLMLYTLPGAPTIYYGDEAGQVGWTDPDNRRTYPWGHEDLELIDLHRALAHLRQALPCLKDGSYLPLAGGEGYVAYARFNASACAVAIVNCLERPLSLRLPLWRLGLSAGTVLTERIRTTVEGCIRTDMQTDALDAQGCLRVTLPGRSSLLCSCAY